MKNLIILTAALMLVSCKKEEKSGGITDAISNVKNLNTLNNSLGDMEKNTEKLKSLTPLNNDDLKALLPEQLLGLKRSELSVGDNAMMKISNATSRYKNEEGTKNITLEITDGAGETGSAIVSLLMLSLNMNQEKQTETGFEKSTEINGIRALVSENKYNETIDSKIQMIAKERYLINLQGDGMSYEELKKAVEEINWSNFK